jgi:release factor glutamine methyltransferase
MHDVADAELWPTLATALRRATADLRRAGIDEAGNEARRVAAAALGLSAAQVLSRPELLLSPAAAAKLARWVARRAAREPLSRILGEREFYGRAFAISPATLDPRPDSETLVEAALALVDEEGWRDRPLRILDVATGSGCLLSSLLAELPLATGIGTDRSEAALQVARDNARRLGLARRAGWIAADMLESVRGDFDIVISNPPYIPDGEIAGLDPEVGRFDPHSALAGGSDGLHFFHRLAATLASAIHNGWVLLEVGHGQADAVAALLSTSLPAAECDDLRYFLDVAGRRRCVAARARN